jgi:DNA-binding GntR family transcriptional regulator
MLELIQPISKRDQVVRAMKQAILSGTIEPGASIVESKIAQQLGAGVPLIREALIELEHQGFVQRTPYKGTTVTKLSPADVRRIFALRVELEAVAIEWAKEHTTEADITYLRQTIGRMEEAAKNLDLPQFYDCDLAFHRKICRRTRATGCAVVCVLCDEDEPAAEVVRRERVDARACCRSARDDDCT